MKARIALTALALMTIAGPLRAEWKRVRSFEGEYLLAMSSVGPKEFFVSGMFIDPASRLPVPQPRVYWTQDGGVLLKSILGNLPSSLTGGIPVAIHFVDTKTGYVGMGNKVYRTLNRGVQWQGLDLGKAIRAIKFVSANIGFVAGEEGLLARTEDGGQTWTSIETQTKADLNCLFFVGRNLGFAAGAHTVEEVDQEGNTTTTYKEAVVLLTSDGGREWRKGFATSGISLCPLFFLDDGKRGWLAATIPDKAPGGRRSKALLLSTRDGGLSFEDEGLDVRVGTLHFMMTIPLEASYFATMYWEDEFRGHLAGAAYLLSITSGSGGEQHYYRIVDFLTMDGGQTWKRTDLGTISISMGGGVPTIQGDGQVFGGEMRSMFEGWLIGDNSGVWTYRYSCKTHADCGEGYVCNANSSCEALAPPAPCAGEGCTANPGETDNLEADIEPDRDAIEPARDALGPSDVIVNPTDAPRNGSSGGGCQAGFASGSRTFLWLILMPLAGLCRRRTRMFP